MKTNPILLLLVLSLFTTTGSAQKPAPANGEPRITFMLKNTLGYHRMFLVQGPGIAYGFTMSKRETVPCNWPVGSKLYFSQEGKTSTGLILTVTAADEGKTLTTDTGASESKLVAQTPSVNQEIRVYFRNNSSRFRKVAMITYRPDQTGNATNIFTMVPFGVTSRLFPIGTKVYFANDQQVDLVMSGKRLDGGKPLITVKKEDAGKSFNIFE